MARKKITEGKDDMKNSKELPQTTHGYVMHDFKARTGVLMERFTPELGSGTFFYGNPDDDYIH
jgi:hypothetical protein